MTNWIKYVFNWLSDRDPLLNWLLSCGLMLFGWLMIAFGSYAIPILVFIMSGALIVCTIISYKVRKARYRGCDKRLWPVPKYELSLKGWSWLMIAVAILFGLIALYLRAFIWPYPFGLNVTETLSEHWDWVAVGLLLFWIVYSTGRYLIEKQNITEGDAHKNWLRGLAIGGICFVGLLGSEEVMKYFGRKVPLGAKNQVVLMGSGTVDNYLASKDAIIGERISVELGSSIILWHFEGTSGSGLDILTAAYEHGRDEKELKQLPLVAMASREIDPEKDFATDTPGAIFFEITLKKDDPIWWVIYKKGTSSYKQNACEELYGKSKTILPQLPQLPQLSPLELLQKVQNNYYTFLHARNSGTRRTLEMASTEKIVYKLKVCATEKHNTISNILKYCLKELYQKKEITESTKNNILEIKNYSELSDKWVKEIVSTEDSKMTNNSEEYIKFEKEIKKIIVKEIQSDWGQLNAKNKDFSLELKAMKIPEVDEAVLVYGSNFLYDGDPIKSLEKFQKENPEYRFCKVRKGIGSHTEVTRPLKIAGRIRTDKVPDSKESNKDTSQYTYYKEIGFLGDPICKMLRYFHKVKAVNLLDWKSRKRFKSQKPNPPCPFIDWSHHQCTIKEPTFQYDPTKCKIRIHHPNKQSSNKQK